MDYDTLVDDYEKAYMMYSLMSNVPWSTRMQGLLDVMYVTLTNLYDCLPLEEQKGYSLPKRCVIEDPTSTVPLLFEVVDENGQ
jgi:hypothetical protein